MTIKQLTDGYISFLDDIELRFFDKNDNWVAGQVYNVNYCNDEEYGELFVDGDSLEPIQLSNGDHRLSKKLANLNVDGWRVDCRLQVCYCENVRTWYKLVVDLDAKDII